MSDSELQAAVTTKEVEFIQRYSWEQLNYLGHPDHSPATAWLRKHGLTNLDIGRLAVALQERNLPVPIITAEPKTEFQSPWSNRDVFLNRLEELTSNNGRKPT